MKNSEKLCLKWNDFQENINADILAAIVDLLYYREAYIFMVHIYVSHENLDAFIKVLLKSNSDIF